MSLFHNPGLYTISGIAVVTAIDSLGSIASRKFNFPYARLALLSLAFYGLMGFLVSRQFGLAAALLTNGIIGFYDGTIGWKLSLALNANMDEEQAKLQHMPLMYSGTVVTLMALSFGYMGYLAA